MDPWYTEEGPDNESNREPDVNVPPNVPIYQQFIPPGDGNLVEPMPLGLSSVDALQPTVAQSMSIPQSLVPSHIDQPGEGKTAPYSVPLDNETEVLQRYHHSISGLSQMPTSYIRPGTIENMDIASNSHAMESNMMVPNLDTNPHTPQKPTPGTKVSSSLSKRTTRRSSRSSESHHSSPTDESPETHTTKPITKRSRMGCLTCRQRKKRCCEKRPQCTECLRLGLECIWPVPGTEHRNKSRESREDKNTIEHEAYGKIKVLRGIVEYKSK